MNKKRLTKIMVLGALVPMLGACASLFGMHRQGRAELRDIYGLIGVLPTERVNRITPLLDPTDATGGASFDKTAATLFTANYQGIAIAYDVRNEGVRWRYDEDEALTMTPFYIAAGEAVGVNRPLIIEGAQSGRILALDAEKGTKVWSYDLGGELRERPTLAGGRLLITNSRNQVAALDPASGKWLWQYSREFPPGMTVLGHSGATVVDGMAYVGFADGFVSAIRIEDGVGKWSRPLTLKGQGFGDADATPEVVGKRVFAASFEDGVYALDKDTGDIVWQMSLPGVTRLATHDPYLFAASASGELAALDADSGQPIWKVKFPAAQVTKPVVYRGYIVLGTNPGGLRVFDEGSGQPMQSMATDVVSELTLEKGTLAFMSSDSIIYLMRYGGTSAATMAAPHRWIGL